MLVCCGSESEDDGEAVDVDQTSAMGLPTYLKLRVSIVHLVGDWQYWKG